METELISLILYNLGKINASHIFGYILDTILDFLFCKEKFEKFRDPFSTQSREKWFSTSPVTNVPLRL